MKDICEKVIETDYDNLNEALGQIEYNIKTGLIIYYNDTKYEFLLNIKKDVDELLCLSSSVLKVDDLERFHKKPLFHRLSWKFRQSTILFNDPTRYVDVDDDYTKDLQGGWSVGTYDDYFLRNISEMILQIASYFNFTNDKILFYGSSMGGFTSLMLGTMIKGSMVLADLPQLYLMNFGHFTSKVIGKLYSDYSDEELEKVSYKFSFMGLMKKENYVPDDSIDYVNRRFDEKKLEGENSFTAQISKIKKHNRYLTRRLDEKDLSIEYYSNLSSFNKLFSGFNSRIYIILKSIASHENIGTNLSLYKLLKSSDFFDVGFYLKQKNLKGTRFYSTLNPIVHYLFFGMGENVSFNRTLKFEFSDKKELLKILSEIKK